MALPNLTPAIIQDHATEASYSRGQSYFRSGAVVSLIQRKQTLQAEVEGSEVTPYRVTIDFDGGGVIHADLHLSLLVLRAGASTSLRPYWPVFISLKPIEQRPTLTQLLDSLSAVQTQGLVQSLIDAHPELISEIDFYVSQLAGAPVTSASGPASPKRQTTVDPAPFQRRAREILRTTVRGLGIWPGGGRDCR
jgi:uncharacterized Zn finger protein